MIRFLRLLVTLVNMFISSAMAQPTLLVVGDSISAGYGIEVKQGWVALLQKKLLSERLNYQVVNASISGDTTAGGLARIDNALAQAKPQWVLLELGANDGLRGLSIKEMKNNLTQIVHRSQQAGAKVALLEMKLPPNYGGRYVAMFDQAYPQLASALNVPLVHFILQDVALKKELMQKDGLHPNENGQALIMERIWNVLKVEFKK